MTSLEPLLVLSIAVADAEAELRAARCDQEIRNGRIMHSGIVSGIARMAEETPAPLDEKTVETALLKIRLAAEARQGWLDGMRRNLQRVTA